VVHFWVAGAAREVDTQPEAAIVTYVHNDHTVNLFVMPTSSAHMPPGGKANVSPYSVDNVTLLQPEDTVLPSGAYCEWMPYQQAVAKGVQPANQHVSSETASGAS
jgi:hypothetical protein